ncbi:hypothetical protein NE237_017389 [Protea cynaroides]|uniref:Uncharacterized protein n=1 Tax=Protea cynaroides TaxID=273540 RepID=A0A9Q0K800_9MAGN|nr:hypothetical protein NE237_017389 [Protea cynaroides]
MKDLAAQQKDQGRKLVGEEEVVILELDGPQRDEDGDLKGKQGRVSNPKSSQPPDSSCLPKETIWSSASPGSPREVSILQQIQSSIHVDPLSTRNPFEVLEREYLGLGDVADKVCSNRSGQANCVEGSRKTEGLVSDPEHSTTSAMGRNVTDDRILMEVRQVQGLSRTSSTSWAKKMTASGVGLRAGFLNPSASSKGFKDWLSSDRQVPTHN